MEDCLNEKIINHFIERNFPQEWISHVSEQFVIAMLHVSQLEGSIDALGAFVYGDDPWYDTSATNIDEAFDWEMSPQGSDFWIKVSDFEMLGVYEKGALPFFENGGLLWKMR